jgi:uncharacterized protein YyaL (SSP411 family)
VYEASFDWRWIREAERLAEIMISQFRDPDEAGFFLEGGHERLIHRPKELFDHATPSGNSVAAHALLRLAGFTGNEKWAEPTTALLKSMLGPMTSHPAAFANLLGALDLALSGAWEIVVVGEMHEQTTQALLHEVFKRYLPNRILVCGMDPGPHLLRDRKRISGLPTAYVCRNHVCHEPVTDASALASILDAEIPCHLDSKR